MKLTTTSFCCFRLQNKWPLQPSKGEKPASLNNLHSSSLFTYLMLAQKRHLITLTSSSFQNHRSFRRMCGRAQFTSPTGAQKPAGTLCPASLVRTAAEGSPGGGDDPPQLCSSHHIFYALFIFLELEENVKFLCLIILKIYKPSKNISTLYSLLLFYLTTVGSLLQNICPRRAFFNFLESPPHLECHTRYPFPLPPSVPYCCSSVFAYNTCGGVWMDGRYPPGCFCVAAVRPAGRLCQCVFLCILMCSVTLSKPSTCDILLPQSDPTGPGN